MYKGFYLKAGLYNGSYIKEGLYGTSNSVPDLNGFYFMTLDDLKLIDSNNKSFIAKEEIDLLNDDVILDEGNYYLYSNNNEILQYTQV